MLELDEHSVSIFLTQLYDKLLKFTWARGSDSAWIAQAGKC